jgi:hypothetical protein
MSTARVEIDDVYAIGLMAEYLAGPGFTGWLAYLDQQVQQTRTACKDCGHPHALPDVDAATVRANLERFMTS